MLTVGAITTAAARADKDGGDLSGDELAGGAAVEKEDDMGDMDTMAYGEEGTNLAKAISYMAPVDRDQLKVTAKRKKKSKSVPRSKRGEKSKTKPKVKARKMARSLNLPPEDSQVEYMWPSGPARGWHQATYVRQDDAPDEQGCQDVLLDAKGEKVDMCGISLSDLRWNILVVCETCKAKAKGSRACHGCSAEFDEESSNGDGSDSSDRSARGGS